MIDALGPDVPDEVIRALDARAESLGLSCSDHLRGRPAQEAMVGRRPVTAAHLPAFAETSADLADAEVMKGALE